MRFDHVLMLPHVRLGIYICLAEISLLLYRRKILGPLSEADRFPQGCRVIAFDRPPFGLTERPLQWPGGNAMSPYTSEVCLPY